MLCRSSWYSLETLSVPCLRSALKVPVLYLHHEILAAGIEVDNFHYRTDRRFSIEIGVARDAEAPAHQNRIAAGAQRVQGTMVRLEIIKEKSEMMEALAPPFQMFLVTGLAGEMLDEFDLGVARVGECEFEIVLHRPPAECFARSGR